MTGGLGASGVARPDQARVVRSAPIKDAILRLADGTRTAAEIAAEIGVTQQNVRARLHQLGIAHFLRPAARWSMMAARFPADVVLRDLRLGPDVEAWVRGQMEGGACVQDVLRDIITDTCHEETGL